MLTFLLDPSWRSCPSCWRRSLSFRESIEWRIASVLSGFGEMLLAIVAFFYWYSYSMNSWVSRGLDAAMAGKMGPNVTGEEIGFAAWVMLVAHPVTWLLAFVFVEGSVRLVGAAFTENHLGILPLFLFDNILLKITGRSGPGIAQAAGYAEGNVSSYVGTLRDKVRSSRVSIVPDELRVSREQVEEFLEIRSYRRKQDWDPPRTVRYLDAFYRLEACSPGPEPRPFRYRLRRLSAGVMGRTVLVYSPDQTPMVCEK
jgi:hypothetical protein